MRTLVLWAFLHTSYFLHLVPFSLPLLSHYVLVLSFSYLNTNISILNTIAHSTLRLFECGQFGQGRWLDRRRTCLWDRHGHPSFLLRHFLVVWDFHSSSAGKKRRLGVAPQHTLSHIPSTQTAPLWRFWEATETDGRAGRTWRFYGQGREEAIPLPSLVPAPAPKQTSPNYSLSLFLSCGQEGILYTHSFRHSTALLSHAYASIHLLSRLIYL